MPGRRRGRRPGNPRKYTEARRSSGNARRPGRQGDDRGVRMVRAQGRRASLRRRRARRGDDRWPSSARRCGRERGRSSPRCRCTGSSCCSRQRCGCRWRCASAGGAVADGQRSTIQNTCAAGNSAIGFQVPNKFYIAGGFGDGHAANGNYDTFQLARHDVSVHIHAKPLHKCASGRH